jgi:predicted outer membrane repeat protein
VILKKFIKIFLLLIISSISFALDLYPVERAVLNEIISTNNLIQPISGNPITLETSFLLESIPWGTGLPTIELEDNCTSTYCRIVGIDFSEFNITSIPESFNQLILLDSLDLSYNNITTLPESFYSFDELRFLNISNNNLSEISSYISTQQNLYHLNLSGNDISELPETIEALQQLKYLNIGSNNLIDFSFTNLVNINELFINGNNISELSSEFCEMNINWSEANYSVIDNHLCSNLPDCIADNNSMGNQVCNELQKSFLTEIINQNNISENSSSNDINNNDGVFEYNELGYQRWELGELIELNLSTNNEMSTLFNYNISYFPSDLSELTTLQHLDLSHNSLNVIPDEIGLLTELLTLKYNNNFITGNLTSGGIPTSIENLLNLEILSLSNNYITIPNPSIYQLINLKELYLDNNQIYYIDNDLGDLVNMEILTINNNEISSIPDDIRFLSNLKELNASNNQLLSFNSYLNYLGQLQYLNLGNNYISEIPSSINQINNLRKLYLSNNQISIIPNELFNLFNLRELYLQYNSIYELPDRFNNLSHLEVFQIQYNQLHELPSSICQIDVDFSLSGSEINSFLKFQQNYFCFNLPSCINLHIDSQQIIGEQDCYGSDLQVLSEILDLNQISGSPTNWGVWENDRLVELNMSNQNITELPENLGYLAELKILEFKNNQIITIPNSIEFLVNLDSLDLSNNNLTNLSTGFSELEDLNLLNLSGNDIENYPTVIDSIFSLNILNLSNNNIQFVSDNINNLENLYSLNLSNNNIEQLPEDLSSLININYLDISNNEITDIPNSFISFSQLQKFYAQNNEISSVPNIFEQLYNLIEIDLSNNQIIELDNNFFISNYLTDVNLSDNKLLRLPSSLCDAPISNIDVSNNYLYCALGFEEEQYFGFMNEVNIPSCIAENINLNLIGLDESLQECEFYGCTADQESSTGLALNYENHYQMSCSSTGLETDLNDCCLFANGPKLYVSPIGSDVNGDGSYDLPFASIDLAIQYAGDLDTVIVEVGEYLENINIINKDAVSIFSRAVFETDPILKKFYLENTIINGGNYESCLNIENSGDSHLLISGFTIEKGRNNYGGGIKLLNSSAKITDVIIRDNSASVNGGGIYIAGLSSIELENAIIDSNTSISSSGFGGGIYVEGNSILFIIDSDIAWNKGNSGGGIYLNNYRNVEFNNCEIRDNIAINNGGGIFNTNDSLNFIHKIVENENIQDTLITKITGNYSRNGGGIYQLNSNYGFDGIVVNNNTAEENGGAIFVQNTTSQFNNLILKNNTANKGGAIYVSDSDLNIYHLTGYMNFANIASNIYTENSPNINIVNSIFWEESDSDYFIDNSNFIIKNSIISSLFEGENNIYLLPEFSDLQNFSLSRVSKALGNGINDSNIPLKDIYGNNRIQSINDNEIQNPDIGGVENELGEINFINWYVSHNGNDNNSGILEEDSPLLSINLAIEKSLNGDRIYIMGNGSYEENIIFNGKNVKLMNYSYFEMGTENCTIVSESIIENLEISGKNYGPVIKILNGEDNVEICGITIINGDANYGAGLFISNASPLIESVKLSNNNSLFDGGGIFTDGFDGELKNIIIDDNQSSRDGAGAFLLNSSPIMVNIIIENNSGRINNYDLNGGGLYLNNSSPQRFENIKIKNNHASKNGGGLYLANSNISSAIGLEINGNNSNQFGGGIYSNYSNLNIEGSYITYIIENEATNNGGGVYFKNGELKGDNIHFLLNNSSSDGGAIYIDNGGEVILEETIIQGNIAENDGGAINLNGYNTKLEIQFGEIINNSSETSAILYANNGLVKLQNVLIESNQSESYPSGLLIKNSNISLLNTTITTNKILNQGIGGNINFEQYGTLKIINSILWGNDGSELYLKPDGFPKNVYTSHSTMNNGREGIINSINDSIYYFEDSNLNIDPKFISPEKGFYYITKESPCVDAGTNLFMIESDTVLYIPNELNVDGNGDGISLPDMGAYDKQVLSVFPGDLNNDGNVDLLDINSVISFFHKTGIPRYSQGLNWSTDGHGAIAWDNFGSISGSALTYADADGNGLIDEKDVLAIGLNWGNEHLIISSANVIVFNENEIVELYHDEILTIYKSLSGNGDGFTKIKEYLEELLHKSSIPIKYSLGNNFPNPFNPTTNISFSLPKNCFVSLNIYNINGERVKNIIENKSYPLGNHIINLNASELSTGIYFYKLETADWENTKKMILVK